MQKRKLPRLRNFDYSSAKIYFVTFNCHEGLHLLGEIIESNTSIFRFSKIGFIADKSVQDIEAHYPGVQVLSYVIMPNHVHILISLINAEKAVNLSTIIGACKSTITREARIEYPGIILWQKSFNDHIIRDEKDYLTHGEYIEINVQRWKKDKYFTWFE